MHALDDDATGLCISLLGSHSQRVDIVDLDEDGGTHTLVGSHVLSIVDRRGILVCTYLSSDCQPCKTPALCFNLALAVDPIRAETAKNFPARSLSHFPRILADIKVPCMSSHHQFSCQSSRYKDGLSGLSQHFSMYKSSNLHTMYSYTFSYPGRAESIVFMPDFPAGRSCYFTMSFSRYRETLLEDQSMWLDIECGTGLNPSLDTTHTIASPTCSAHTPHTPHTHKTDYGDTGKIVLVPTRKQPRS